MSEEDSVAGRSAQTYLFADPVSHTLSPVMHNAAFAACRLPGVYQARRVPPAELGAAIAGLRAPGVLGANLTIPHKETALAHMDSLSGAARAIGAINTIIHQGGHLRGDNTDAPGLAAALREAGDPGGPTVVLGAGGAARAAVYALRLQERQVFVVNRTLARARALTAALGGEALDRASVPWSQVALIVNASSAGLNDPAQTPLPEFDFAALLPTALVYDMVYKPGETRLMREARAAGLRAENGLGMLAQQARLAFVAWTGCQVGVEVFVEALRQHGVGQKEVGPVELDGAELKRGTPTL
ncbi:shikimate dehydrogenase [Deinococcus alpinitundrae]|uniref:shikimate dehydrogenase n=1 Tax=Deinococcus alpinitundrae TaxID=468913 RepID=UPI001379BD05|nr:shikimate dehydrogenase [Deinococcus alpinitundrae]